MIKFARLKGLQVSEDHTVNAVRRQIEAMACQVYEVGLYKPNTQGDQTEPEMLPRTWDENTLIRSIQWLRFQNRNGRNIYVRPHGEHSLTLLDDLDRQALMRLNATGFKPALVVETSPHNFQAWLNHGRQLPRALSSAAARALATRFGSDQSSADWRHFGRLSGFTNRKPARARADGTYPFVKLIEASGQVYDQAATFVDTVSAELEAKKSAALKAAVQTSRAAAGRSVPKTIHDFRNNPAYGGDGNRIDLAYAVYALSHGVPDADVRNAIAERDLTHKGNETRQLQYLDRTIKKALGGIRNTGR